MLTAGALALLVADVLLPRRSPLADLGRRGGAGRDRHRAAAVPQRPRRGLERTDRGRSVRVLLQGRVPHRRDLDRADVGALPGDRRRQPGRVLLPDPLRDARHDDHGRRHRSHHRVHRPRDDGGLVLHPGRLHQAEPAIERSRGQVLPARRLLARHPAVRHVAAVRPVGHDEPARHGDGVRRTGTRPAARAGGHAGRRGHGLQDRRGAVPHVGAGRLRRRADAGHGVPVGRIEGGVVRDAAADFPRGAAVDERRLAPALRGAGDRHDDGREYRGADAVEPQADARVLVDRARRLPADRRRRRHAARRDGDADLSADLLVHAARRVRGHRA